MKKEEEKEKLFGRLYYSIYKENINEVWNILKCFPASCRKNFLINIKKLSFEQININKLQELAEYKEVSALASPSENKIYLNEFKNTKTEINHELFHVSSYEKDLIGTVATLIVDNYKVEIGNNLNEGITEYLALKSTNKNKIENAYGLDVFTVDSLIKIYGKNILIPYFKNSPSKFFSQFKNNQLRIIELDLILKEINNNIETKNTFEEFITMKDFNPYFLEEKNIYLNISNFNIENFTKWLNTNDHKEKINDLYDNIINKENKEQYKITKKENDILYKNFKKEYTKIQKELFESIIKTIITLSRDQNISDALIKENIKNSLKPINAALEMIEYKNNKLIKKK